MKTIGLIGGMSWESSAEYYRIINETIKIRLGGFHSAECVLYSVDFAEIEALQRREKWPETAQILSRAAKNVEAAGADFILLCTNTMHKVAPDIESAVRIPLLHIADATAKKICARGLRRIGLLGTRFTMEEDFYKGRLSRKHGLDVLVPDPTGRQTVHRVIYQELVVGRIEQASRKQLLVIMERLARSGAEGVILGCTELGLLVKEKDSPVPLFDTTLIHAEAAVDFALES
ncbi:MAG: aspartate/glutamate racemase family protein [Candidatus Aminicenantales bacterium]